MFDIGFLELVVIGVLALLILGPDRLPGAARTAGMWIGKAKRMVSQFSSELDRQIRAEELRAKLKEEGDELGLEKIQQTVDDALSEAKKFEDKVTIMDADAAGNVPPVESGKPVESIKPEEDAGPTRETNSATANKSPYLGSLSSTNNAARTGTDPERPADNPTEKSVPEKGSSASS